MNFDVFISYAHQDKAAADAACAKIEAEGIRCWIAPRDVPPGAEWAGAIINAIDHCRVMVLIFSSSSNGSRQIDREAQRAFDKEKSVIPFRIEDIAPQNSLAYYLGPVHWLDALTPPLDQHLQKLSTSVKALVQADKPGDDREPLTLQKTETRQEAEAKGLAEEQERQRLESKAAASREAEESARQAAVAEAESQRRERDAAAARQAEAQRIAEEQRRQQAEAERLAREEKDRVRAAEAAQLAEKETQNKKVASEAAAPSDKAGLRRTLTIGALGMIAVIVAIAIWIIEHPQSDNFPSCYKADASAEVAACTQAIALDPKDDWAYTNRCSAYFRLGNYRAALADCNLAIALNYPDNWSAYNNRGLTYEKLGMNAAAIADYQKVLTMNPSQQGTQYAQDALKRLGASPAAPGGR